MPPSRILVAPNPANWMSHTVTQDRAAKPPSTEPLGGPVRTVARHPARVYTQTSTHPHLILLGEHHAQVPHRLHLPHPHCRPSPHHHGSCRHRPRPAHPQRQPDHDRARRRCQHPQRVRHPHRRPRSVRRQQPRQPGNPQQQRQPGPVSTQQQLQQPHRAPNKASTHTDATRTGRVFTEPPEV